METYFRIVKNETLLWETYYAEQQNLRKNSGHSQNDPGDFDLWVPSGGGGADSTENGP